MSQTLRKRGREPQALADSNDVHEPKRFHGEETDGFLYLMQSDKTSADLKEDEECALKEVMRNLEEEIVTSCSTVYFPSSSGDDTAASDISRKLDSDAEFDLSYLLEASDDDLGIPPSPLLDLKDEVCLSMKETSEGLWENPDLQSLCDNWHFEDEFENCPQLELYEDAWDASALQDSMNRDIFSQDMFFEGDISAAWTL